MPYIGKLPTTGAFQKLDAISTVNGQAAYTMQIGGVDFSPESPNHMLVTVNGILQAPTTNYTISSSTISFTSALVTGDVINSIIILGDVLNIGTPSDATVTTGKIVDGNVTLAKLSATGTKNSTTFLRGDNTFAEAGGGKILQVVSGFKNDKSSTTSSSYVAISGLTASLTPSSTSSKVFIICHLGTVSTSTANRQQMFAFHRDIGGAGYSAIGESSGSTRNFAFGDNFASISSPQDTYNAFGHSFLDSPNTTSAVTYKLYHKVFQHPDLSGTPTGAVGGRQADGSFGGSCSITIMEVGA